MLTLLTKTGEEGEMKKAKPSVWLRFNADGILIAFLALGAGFDLYNPNATDIAHELGYIPPSFFMWTFLYMFGGLCMLTGFVRKSMGFEVAGRLCVACAFFVESARIIGVWGLQSNQFIESFYIGCVIIFFFAVRVGVLLSKDGVVFLIPPRGNGKKKDNE